MSDLLDPSNAKRDVHQYLKLREDTQSRIGHCCCDPDPAGGVFVDGLTEHIIKTAEEITNLLVVGSSARETASTNMNKTSSRSHALFTIIVEHSESTTVGSCCF